MSKENHEYDQFLQQSLGFLSRILDHNPHSLEKNSQLTSRIINLYKQGLQDIESLAEEMEKNDALYSELISTATINTTYFFREWENVEQIIMELLSAPRFRPIRILSAACSSGEEVYSLAASCMLLKTANKIDRSFTLTGFDIDQNAIDKARKGRYKLSAIDQYKIDAKESLDELKKHISKEQTSFTINKQLKDSVRFFNWDSRDPLNNTVPFDLILCRNMLIYFDKETCEKITENLSRILHPGGFILVGKSDPKVISNSSKLQKINSNLFRKKSAIEVNRHNAKTTAATLFLNQSIRLKLLKSFNQSNSTITPTDSNSQSSVIMVDPKNLEVRNIQSSNSSKPVILVHTNSASDREQLDRIRNHSISSIINLDNDNSKDISEKIAPYSPTLNLQPEQAKNIRHIAPDANDPENTSNLYCFCEHTNQFSMHGKLLQGGFRPVYCRSLDDLKNNQTIQYAIFSESLFIQNSVLINNLVLSKQVNFAILIEENHEQRTSIEHSLFHGYLNSEDHTYRTIENLMLAKRIAHLSHSWYLDSNYYRQAFDIIIIGISVGGPPTLRQLLPLIHAEKIPPIFLAQHTLPDFNSSLGSYLSRYTNLKIVPDLSIASGQSITVRRDHLYVAPPGFHMTLSKASKQIQVNFVPGPLIHGHRPSIDFLSHSVAALPSSISVLFIHMTGMGKDGLSGSRLLHSLGHTVCVQEPQSCTVFGMGKETVLHDAADYALTLPQIANIINMQSVAKNTCNDTNSD